ncbi:DinB family protein [Streptomyces roseirectus]|uniref:DinB family protein n=1 Tax=Streptomyces roseirectus TaxID=2768066 RepID=A0A7H0I9L1_9ACTN|nr:DinB family protein [Streptomyces roseirectus]QNP69477.1 DinB family protein [Streptomyces roseirectus]
MTNPSRLELLRWQTDFTWSLFEYHLDRLEPEDHLWEPAANCWTLRPDGAGGWVPDWAETEPEPVPVPTVAWVGWHVGWWLGTATDHVRGGEVRARDDVKWPGPGEPAVAWLREVYAQWAAAVDALDEGELGRPSGYPWSADAGLTVGHLLAWVNAELMKNVAEIGQLRLIRAA